MPDQPNQERTEPATQRRKDDAREKGQVARSIEINSVLILIACLLFFIMNGNQMLMSLKALLIEYFKMAAYTHLTPDTIYVVLSDMILKSIRISAPFLVLMVLTGIMGNLIQFGFLFTTNPLIPDFKKIDPVSGFSRVFSRRAWIDLIKSLFKVIIISWIAYLAIKNSLGLFFDMTGMDVPGMSFLFNTITLSILFKIILGLVVIAVLDFSYQRWEYSQNLRMTRQEIREEYKQYEGDPMIKSRIRSIQREMSRRRMLKAVPEAEVIITNPTHLAIALRYDREKDPAPRVVAKGADYIAEKIRNLARDYQIPIVENRPLAQALYKSCELDDLIPEDLYRAVAEVLAYIFKLKGKSAVA